MDTDIALISVRNLKKQFSIRKGLFGKGKQLLNAVDDVSFDIHNGETLGLVGESGCGKTTVGRTILRLYKPTSGDILFNPDGRSYNLATMTAKELKPVRKMMQIVFQDPYSSLDPRNTIKKILEEPLITHGVGTRDERKAQLKFLIEAVGMKEEHLKRYPHEFSGGQRQRIAIARALALRPKLVVADEPVSALDVSIQAQVLNLLEDLQKEFGTTYLFIAHNLGVIRHLSTRIAVMYLGKVVELGPSERLFIQPEHPYTEALLSSILSPEPDGKTKKIILSGDVPNPIDLPSGCRFHTRCRYAESLCASDEPALRDVGDGHHVACHFNLGAR
ncbi:MAG: oligopeptide/dipeptide ABC transporter ATP-binding protein [Treponemataceae bacterium]